jgi:hypothetical protein
MQTYIPDDENGIVLRGMVAGGDTLQKPRIIDYCFVFPTRSQALEFAASVGEIDYEVCISYYEEKRMWESIVKKFMIPDHTEITRIESDLTGRAEVAGGIADGWGCMRIVEKNETA